MTTGRINQVTTDDCHSVPPHPTRGGAGQGGAGPGRSPTLADGRPSSLTHSEPTTLALQTLQVQSPADAGGGSSPRPRPARRGSTTETVHPLATPTQTIIPLRATTQPPSQESHTASHSRDGCTPTGEPSQPGRRGHGGTAPLRRRDVLNGLKGSPVAPRLYKRHRRVGIGAGSAAALDCDASPS